LLGALRSVRGRRRGIVLGGVYAAVDGGASRAVRSFPICEERHPAGQKKNADNQPQQEAGPPVFDENLFLDNLRFNCFGRLIAHYDFFAFLKHDFAPRGFNYTINLL
jgi:hypothetical protein